MDGEFPFAAGAFSTDKGVIMTNEKTSSPHDMAKLKAQSKFDDLIKYSNGLPIEYGNRIDNLNEMLSKPMPDEDNLPFDREHQ